MYRAPISFFLAACFLTASFGFSSQQDCKTIAGTFVEVRTGAPLEIQSDCAFAFDTSVTDPDSGAEYPVIFTYPFRFSTSKNAWVAYGRYRDVAGCFFPVDLRLSPQESGSILNGYWASPMFVNSLCDYSGMRNVPLHFEKVQ